MIYHSTESILRGKQKEKQEKTKTHPNTKFLPIFQMVGTKTET